MNNLKFTDRELKGYNFENLVDKSINGNNFIRNSVRGVGSDFKHEYYPIEVECKFSHAVIYPSWIKRDWLSRFSSDVRFKVVVSNRGMKLSNECFRLLKVNRIIHVYFDQLKETIEFLIALCSSEGVTSCRTKEGYKFKCYSVKNVKDCNFNVFNGVDLAEDYGKFLFNQHKNSKLSKETIKLLKEIEDRNLPIEIIFINNQKEMDKFIESLKRGKDKAEDPNKYNENINYKKLLNKELREHKRRTRQQIIIDNFMKQLQDSVNEWGIIEVPVLCQWGIVSGESRLKLVKDKPIDINELLSPEICRKYGWKWLDIPNKEDYYRLRIELGLIRNPVRNEILQYAKYLEGQGIKPENMVKTLHEKLKGRLTERTIRNYLPKELKRSYSNSERLSELMFTKEPMATLCFRLPKGLKIDYQNKFKENIGLYLRFFMKFHLEHPELISEDKLQQYFIEHQPQEIRETIQHTQEILENKQEQPTIIEYKPSKFDFCEVCNRTTRHIWNSFTQEYICGECYAKEMNKVTNQSPARIVIGRRE